MSRTFPLRFRQGARRIEVSAAQQSVVCKRRLKEVRVRLDGRAHSAEEARVSKPIDSFPPARINGVKYALYYDAPKKPHVGEGGQISCAGIRSNQRVGPRACWSFATISRVGGANCPLGSRRRYSWNSRRAAGPSRFLSSTFPKSK